MKTTGLDAVLLALRGDSGLTGAEKGDAGNNPAFTAAFDAAARSAAQQKAPQRDAGSTRRPDSAGAETGKALPGSGSDMPIKSGVATTGEAALEASESAKGSVAAPLDPSLASSPFVKDALERAGATAVPADVKTSALAQPLPTASPPNAIAGTGNTAGDLAARMHEAAGRQPNPTVSSGAPAASGDSPAITSQNKAAQPIDNSAFATAVRTVATEARGPAGAENRVVPGGAAPVDPAPAELARVGAAQTGSTSQLVSTPTPNAHAAAKPSDAASASQSATPRQANETGLNASVVASRLQPAVEGAKTTGLDQGANVRQPGLNTGAALTSAPTPPGAESPSRNDATADTLLRQTPVKAAEIPLAAARTKPAVEGQDNAGRFEGPGTRSTQTAAPLSAAAADGMTARGEVQVEQATMARATGQPGLGEALDHRQALSDRRAAGQPRVTAETKPVSPPSGISPSESATALKTTFNALSNEVSRAPAEQQPVGLKQDVGAASPDPVSRGAEGAASTLVGNSAMPARAAETVSQPLPTQLPDIKQAPDSPEFADEVLARVRMIQGRNGTEARLNLHPAELGRLQIAITSEGDATRVAFVVENAQAKEALEQAMPRLREFLQQAGLQLTDSSVAQQGTRDGGGYGANDPSKGSHAAPSTDTDGEEGPRANPGSDPTRIVDAYA